LFTIQDPAVAQALEAYLKSLRPVPSPQLVDGRLSAAARRGEKIFRSRATDCLRCHAGSLFTNLRSYNVGTQNRCDQPTDMFDVPTLIELWRTAPYLHDGSAATLREVLTSANKNERHGRTAHLAPEQINDLVEYLLSL
jgi:cytochrome c peroxidase